MKRIENYLKDKQSSKSLNNIGIKNFEPYIGPRPFDRDNKDEKRFFGRDYEADEILSLILGHRLVLVYAQSGAGKTSIINAKISPMLEEEYNFQVLPSARIGRISNIENYPSSKVTNNSSNIKNAYMVNALQSLLPKDIHPNSLLDKQQLTDFLKYYYPPTIVDQQTGEVKNQVLVFDQLEEVFTFFPNEKWREQQKDFFQQVTKALKDNIFLRIVFVIREDYLAELESVKELLPERLRPQFRLERLQKANALLAIKNPLKYVPKDILQNYKGDIDKDINEIVNELLKIQIEYSPGKAKEFEGEFIEPIQLQVVAASWFKSVQQNIIYVADVDNALEEFYEDAINEVINTGKVTESYIRKWCEENLITQSGTRSIVYKSSDSTEGLKNDLVKLLENKYFLKENLRAGARWCELTHDRLIKPIISSNQKWRNKHQKRKKWTVVKISIPMVISIIVIYAIFETLYLVPPVESISAGELPFTLAVDQNSGLVYVTNPKSDTISVINGKKNDLIKKINDPNEPTDIAIDPKNNLIYTSHPDKTISVIQKDNFMDVLNPFIKQIPIIEKISGYKKIKSISLNSLPFSLGIDSHNSKLYVTSPPNTVYIIDTTNTDKDPKIIKVGNIPIDLDFDLKLNKVYVVNRGDNTISVIDGTNYDLIKNIPVGKNPSSIVYNPNDNKVYVANIGDNTISVIDGTNYDLIKNIPVGKNPSSIVYNPNDNKVYVANKGDNTVSVINCSLDIVVSIFGVGNSPTSVNINKDQNILYVANNLDDKLTAVDMGKNLNDPITKNLTKNFENFMYSQPSELNINKIPVGSHPSAITLYDNNNTDDQMLYVVNTDSDTVSVIDETKKEIIDQIKVGHKPRDIDIHTVNGMVYVSNSMSNTVTVIDQENKSIKNITTGGKYPTGLAVDEETNLVYVANTDSDTVSVIDGKTNKPKLIQVGNGPTGIAVDSKNNLVYVTNYNDSSVSIIDEKTNEVKPPIQVGNGSNHMNYGNINVSRDYRCNGPISIAVDSNNNKIYILNMFSDNISIIDTDFIIDSLQNNNKTIDQNMKYVTIAIPAGETPTDISLSNEELYVTNRDHNIANILDQINSNT